MKWVRLDEQPKRWHAVYTEAVGVLWTYCARSVRPQRVPGAANSEEVEGGEMNRSEIMRTRWREALMWLLVAAAAIGLPIGVVAVAGGW